MIEHDHMPRVSLEAVGKLLGVVPDSLVGGLNLVEAAALLGIAPSTLRDRALKGKIGYQRDGRSWRFFWWHLAGYLVHREHSARVRSLTGGALSPSGSQAQDELRDGKDKITAEAIELGLIDLP